MSYIVALITFGKSENKFPVQCFRTDVHSMDNVIVRKGDGELSFATIQDLKYLNWNCSGRIECKVSEITRNSSGDIVLPKGSPLNYGMSTSYAFIKELKSHGWVPVKSKSRPHMSIFCFANATKIAYIFVSKNGIDIQAIARTEEEKIKPYSLYDKSFSEGKVVDHFFAHTSFNLFEGILRFSRSFINNETDIERYFIPQGSRDKRTEELKKQGMQRGAKRDYCDFGNLGDYPSDMNAFGYHD